MTLKRKLLGLGLLASLAAVALVAVTASANQEGHFVTTGSASAHVIATEKGHTLEFTLDGFNGGIICNDIKWDALTDNETEIDLVFDPSLKECHTTGLPPSFEIKRNGCNFVFYVAKGTTNSTEQTAKLDCGGGKPIEIPHPNCLITVPGQSIQTGITYTKVTLDDKSAITADFNVQLTMEADGPVCAKGLKTGKIEGSFLIEAFDVKTNKQVDLLVT